MINLINELCCLCGTSGDEDAVREFIISKLPSDVKYRVDALGNLIVEKKGSKTPKNKVMLAAHMDEVGFIVNYITADGYLRITSVGGINPETVIGRQLQFKNGTRGVIGTKAVHQQTEEEREKPVKISSMLLDIGAKSEAEALEKVLPGDCAYFTGEFIEFGSNNDMLKSKALDDRVGCAVMLEMIKGELPYDATFVFTVQEEIGTRGAKAASYSVAPDYAIVLETTTACDFSGNEGEKKVCEVGKGAVVSYMDNGTIYSRELYKMAFDKAKEKNIPCQTKTVVAGGNDSGAIHVSAGGIETVAISVPCRYLHSPACVLSKKDIDAVSKLAYEMYEALCEK
ncbi:MAG: M42 family peptidase [Ruminiclostridium sp.]|nr:M42 family peptidase [Ruminiclostridium sp.]